MPRWTQPTGKKREVRDLPTRAEPRGVVSLHPTVLMARLLAAVRCWDTRVDGMPLRDTAAFSSSPRKRARESATASRENTGAHFHGGHCHVGNGPSWWPFPGVAAGRRRVQLPCLAYDLHASAVLPVLRMQVTSHQKRECVGQVESRQVRAFPMVGCDMGNGPSWWPFPIAAGP